jgi:hypothetical protein
MFFSLRDYNLLLGSHLGEVRIGGHFRGHPVDGLGHESLYLVHLLLVVPAAGLVEGEA